MLLLFVKLLILTAFMEKQYNLLLLLICLASLVNRGWLDWLL